MEEIGIILQSTDGKQIQLHPDIIYYSQVYKNMLQITKNNSVEIIQLNAKAEVIEMIQEWATNKRNMELQQKNSNDWDEHFFTKIIKNNILEQILRLSEFLDIKQLTVTLEKKLGNLLRCIPTQDILSTFAIDENLEPI